jgi:UDP-glucuronate 4-epimerase
MQDQREQIAMRKILVTGTAGFIGSHLAIKLLERGDEVVGLDNINDYYDVNLKYARLNELGIDKELLKDNILVESSKYPKHKFIKANLEDTKIINEIFETQKFDAVCNLAAQAGVRYSIENPHAYIQSNVVGFMNILEACRYNNVKNLSYASSSSVYGLNKSQPFKTSDHTDHPVSLYAATKKSNEMMAHTYSHLYNISTTGLRFFTVYGPWGRPDMAPMLFADAILNDRAIKVFNHGNMSRDFTYIDDIVDGIIKVIDNPSSTKNDFDALNPNPSISTAPYKIYNIGNNSPIQLLDFIETLENSIGIEAKKNFLPMQDGDVVSTYADTNDLIKDFDYKPDTKLSDGIDEFVKWYKEFYSDGVKK